MQDKYKDYANSLIETYVSDAEDSISLYPKKQYSFCISANGVPGVFLESKESTMLLDMDETMLRVFRINPELMDFMVKNPGASDIRPEQGKTSDSKEVSKWTERNLDDFKNVLKNFKHKDKVAVVPHKVFGHVAIAFRPGAKELLDKLEQLIGSKDLKDVQVFTANSEWWAEGLVDALNEYTGKKLSLYNSLPITKDSKLIDDQEGSAKIKLYKAKVTDTIMDGIGNSWIPVKRFAGDFRDRELFKMIKNL